MTDRELMQQSLEVLQHCLHYAQTHLQHFDAAYNRHPSAENERGVITDDIEDTFAAICALRERLAREEPKADAHLFYAPGDFLVCKESYERVVVKHGNTGPLQLANGKIVLEWSDETYGEYTLEQIMDGFILEGLAPQEPTRAEKMREAGYTRRPTLREFPSDKPARQEQEPVAWITEWKGKHSSGKVLDYKKHRRGGEVKHWPLYTHPQAREWVGLTAKDLAEIPPSCFEGAIWAEAKLKEKNGDQGHP